jgi:septum formation inhibitor-activating ATPase MinD
LGNVEALLENSPEVKDDPGSCQIARISCTASVEYILDVYEIADELSVKVVGISGDINTGLSAVIAGQPVRLQACADALRAKTELTWKIIFE